MTFIFNICSTSSSSESLIQSFSAKEGYDTRLTSSHEDDTSPLELEVVSAVVLVSPPVAEDDITAAEKKLVCRELLGPPLGNNHGW